MSARAEELWRSRGLAESQRSHGQSREANVAGVVALAWLVLAEAVARGTEELAPTVTGGTEELAAAVAGTSWSSALGPWLRHARVDVHVIIFVWNVHASIILEVVREREMDTDQ